MAMQAYADAFARANCGASVAVGQGSASAVQQAFAQAAAEAGG